MLMKRDTHPHPMQVRVPRTHIKTHIKMHTSTHISTHIRTHLRVRVLRRVRPDDYPLRAFRTEWEKEEEGQESKGQEESVWCILLEVQAVIYSKKFPRSQINRTTVAEETPYWFRCKG